MEEYTSYVYCQSNFLLCRGVKNEEMVFFGSDIFCVCVL